MSAMFPSPNKIILNVSSINPVLFQSKRSDLDYKRLANRCILSVIHVF
jgi:hypothetical protein